MKEIEEIGLVDARKCLELLFPDERSRPTLRTFLEWKAQGLFPFRRIGRRIFYDVREVRTVIDRRLKVEAGE
jgi:hypothetical protein